MDYQALFAYLLETYAPVLWGLLTLVGTDLLLGVAAAVKLGEFQWVKVADFYKTTVLPKLIGFVGLSFLTFALAQASLPAEFATIVAPLTAGAALTALIADFLGSISKNAQTVFGKPGETPPQP